ncbi:MAG: SBBP repeat-containing protein, partial [Pyrinomonadaceae bacterium]
MLVALIASGLTGHYQRSITEAAKVDLNPAGRASAPDEATRARITEAFGKLPMRFEANQGQSHEKVKFLSRGSGYTLFLTSTEAVLSLSRPEETSDKSSATERGDRKRKGERARRDVLRMRLSGARPTPRVEGADEFSVRSNYFIGNDPKRWRTDVRQYAKVRYTGVYPGIDLIYYGNQQALEYDFIVAPGASPSRIRLAFKGAEEVSIDDEG